MSFDWKHIECSHGDPCTLDGCVVPELVAEGLRLEAEVESLRDRLGATAKSEKHWMNSAHELNGEYHRLTLALEQIRKRADVASASDPNPHAIICFQVGDIARLALAGAPSPFSRAALSGEVK